MEVTVNSSFILLAIVPVQGPEIQITEGNILLLYLVIVSYHTDQNTERLERVCDPITFHTHRTLQRGGGPQFTTDTTQAHSYSYSSLDLEVGSNVSKAFDR